MGNGAKIVIISIVSTIFFFSLTFFLIGYFKPKPGVVLVGSNVSSNVYINGNLMGTTPYEGIFDKGTIMLKVEPVDLNLGLQAFETRVSIISGVKTVVGRDFGKNEDQSGNYMISFEKSKENTSGLIVVTYPENAQIFIDGNPEGFSPYKNDNILEGEHKLVIRADGFLERSIDLSPKEGLRINVFAKLAKIEKSDEKIAGAVSEIKTFVEIQDTPTGFLRVRSEPGSGGREIHQVSPGEKYLFLEEDGDSGWFKIQIEEPKAGIPSGRFGWVSNEFTKLIEEEVQTTTDTPE